MSRIVLVSASVLLGFVPGVTRADEPVDPLVACFAPAARAIEAEGGRVGRDALTGFLRAGETRSFPYVLGVDGCTAFAGIAYSQIRDLDLALFAEGGMELESDVSESAHPYVRFCGAPGVRATLAVRAASGQGAFRIEVIDRAPSRPWLLDELRGACAVPLAGTRTTPPTLGDEPRATVAELADRFAETFRSDGYSIVDRRALQVTPARVERVSIALGRAGCGIAVAIGVRSAREVRVGDVISIWSGDGIVERTDRATRATWVRFCTENGPEPTAFIRSTGDRPSEVIILTMRGRDGVVFPGRASTFVRMRFAELASRAANVGMTLEPWLWGIVDPGGTLGARVDVGPGECVTFAGLVDDSAETADLDIAVTDESNRLIGWDVAPTPEPMVFHCAERSERLRVAATVYGSREPFVLLVGRDAPPAAERAGSQVSGAPP